MANRTDYAAGDLIFGGALSPARVVPHDIVVKSHAADRNTDPTLEALARERRELLKRMEDMKARIAAMRTPS
jgi:hypothetical protein